MSSCRMGEMCLLVSWQTVTFSLFEKEKVKIEWKEGLTFSTSLMQYIVNMGQCIDPLLYLFCIYPLKVLFKNGGEGNSSIEDKFKELSG